MTYKRLGILSVLVMLLALPASALMVSFQLVETGIDERAAIGQHSRLWESGLMAAFFDAGYIVTSSPITWMERVPAPGLAGEIQASFNQAVQGGAQYFILGFIEYNSHRGMIVPVEITVRVYDVNSRLVSEQHFPAGPGRSTTEELQRAQNAGQVVISHMGR